MDPDTIAVPGSWDTALLAAGGGLAVIECLYEGAGDFGFVAARPPGHHASASKSMGFCLLNNIAVSAALLAERGERVLIVDWDVHHGNGTEDIFWDDRRVLYVSTHQSRLYPGTGAADETGGPNAQGLNVNVPLPSGATGDVVRRALEKVAGPVVERFGPTWVLVSAGFDAHRADPLASLRLDRRRLRRPGLDSYGLLPRSRPARTVPRGWLRPRRAAHVGRMQPSPPCSAAHTGPRRRRWAALATRWSRWHAASTTSGRDRRGDRVGIGDAPDRHRGGIVKLKPTRPDVDQRRGVGCRTKALVVRHAHLRGRDRAICRLHGLQPPRSRCHGVARRHRRGSRSCARSCRLVPRPHRARRGVCACPGTCSPRLRRRGRSAKASGAGTSSLRTSRSHSPRWLTCSSLLAVPFMAAGVLLLAEASGAVTRSMRALLDGAIIAGSLLFVSWATALGTVWSSGGEGPFARVVGLAYPLGDVITATVALTSLARELGDGPPAARAPRRRSRLARRLRQHVRLPDAERHLRQRQLDGHRLGGGLLAHRPCCAVAVSSAAPPNRAKKASPPPSWSCPTYPLPRRRATAAVERSDGSLDRRWSCSRSEPRPRRS